MRYQYRVVMYNRATVDLGFDMRDLAEALRTALNKCFAPAWGINATIRVGHGPSPNCLGLVFMDDADAPGALAYHDETTGEPQAKVFVKTALSNGDDVAVATSHELFEMLADPNCNRYCAAGDSLLYPLEVCDAVEEDNFDVLGFKVSNFCLPAWFDPFTTAKVFDFLDTARKPFELTAGGYAQIITAGVGKTVFGSPNKKLRFRQEDRRGHRNEWRVNRKVI